MPNYEFEENVERYGARLARLETLIAPLLEERDHRPLSEQQQTDLDELLEELKANLTQLRSALGFQALLGHEG